MTRLSLFSFKFFVSEGFLAIMKILRKYLINFNKRKLTISRKNKKKNLKDPINGGVS